MALASLIAVVHFKGTEITNKRKLALVARGELRLNMGATYRFFQEEGFKISILAAAKEACP